MMRAIALLLSLLMALVACDKPSEARERELVVFAAASLRDAFVALGTDFERAHPGVKVVFNFAGTQALRTQLEHGARADVLASADQRHMQALLEAKLVEKPRTFAQNEPVIVVAKNPASEIQTLADLPKAERIVIGAAEVPIGRYTLEILERASKVHGSDFRTRVEAKVVSRELNVRQVLAKVTLGEASAGIVYRTDAVSAGDRVRLVTIAPEINVAAEYPIAVVTKAAEPELARAWVGLVLSADGQRVLREHGFVSLPSTPSP